MNVIVVDCLWDSRGYFCNLHYYGQLGFVWPFLPAEQVVVIVAAPVEELPWHSWLDDPLVHVVVSCFVANAVLLDNAGATANVTAAAMMTIAKIAFLCGLCKITMQTLGQYSVHVFLSDYLHIIDVVVCLDLFPPQLALRVLVLLL
jgi:hypothetical protein